MLSRVKTARKRLKELINAGKIGVSLETVPYFNDMFVEKVFTCISGEMGQG